MHLNSIHSIWITNIYFIILFLDHQLSSVKLDDLQLVCMHDFPFDYNIDHEPPEEFCTAKGTFLNKPIPPGVDLDKLRGKKPYVFYFNKVVFTISSEKKVEYVDVTTFYDEINNLIKGKLVDVLVLDFTEKDPAITESTFSEVNHQIVALVKKIKNDYKETLIGLQLYNNAHSNSDNKDFEVSIIDSYIDLYVVASYNYNPCTYKDYQTLMAPPTSQQDLNNTVRALENYKFDLCKVFLTIELLPKSWKNKDASTFDCWTYAHMCGGTDPSKKRKYCIQPLINLFNQASQCRTLKVRGIFIKSADNDDWADNCHCGKYAGLKVINDGFIKDQEETKYTHCVNYGYLKRDHTHH